MIQSPKSVYIDEWQVTPSVVDAEAGSCTALCVDRVTEPIGGSGELSVGRDFAVFGYTPNDFAALVRRIHNGEELRADGSVRAVLFLTLVVTRMPISVPREAMLDLAEAVEANASYYDRRISPTSY